MPQIEHLTYLKAEFRQRGLKNDRNSYKPFLDELVAVQVVIRFPVAGLASSGAVAGSEAPVANQDGDVPTKS